MEKSIKVLDKLASALGRKDEVPNIELAQEIAKNEDKYAVKTLVENLKAKKAIANDCIKVLYEVGEIKPALIANYMEDFMQLLHHKNNRLQWGAMTALYWVSQVKPQEVYEQIVEIINVAEQGSVITRDHAMNILIHLASLPPYVADAFDLLLEQLANSPVNQLPMYAERAVTVITDKHKQRFFDILASRLGDIEKESKRKRIEKVIRKINK